MLPAQKPPWAQPQIPPQGKAHLLALTPAQFPSQVGTWGGCWSDSHRAEALVLPGETSPQLQVVHAPVAPERRGGGEVTSPYPHRRFWPGSARIPCFCVLAAIPFPSRAFLPGGEVAGFGRGFAPCSVWTHIWSVSGAFTRGKAGQSRAQAALTGPTRDANCTSVAPAADGDSSILAALIKLQKLCMLSVMRRPFINSVIKAIKHDPLVLTSLMAG